MLLSTTGKPSINDTIERSNIDTDVDSFSTPKGVSRSLPSPHVSQTTGSTMSRSEMLNIPSGVSRELIERLTTTQQHIKTLVRNHGILSKRHSKNSSDPRAEDDIKLIESYLKKLSKEQEPILEEIRREIRAKNLSSLLDHNRPESSDVTPSISPRIRNDSSSDESSDSDVGICTPIKPKRVNGRKRAGESDDDEIPDYGGETKLEIHEGQYNAFVTNVDRKESIFIPEPSPDFPLELKAPETHFSEASKPEFVANLVLVATTEAEKIKERSQEFSEKRRGYQFKTYVPKLSRRTKKDTIGYLQTLTFSPKALRARAAQTVVEGNGTGRITRNLFSRYASKEFSSNGTSRGSSYSRETSPDLLNGIPIKEELIDAVEEVAPAENFETPLEESSNGHATHDSLPEMSDGPALDQIQEQLNNMEENISPPKEYSMEIIEAENVENNASALTDDLNDPIRPEELQAYIKSEPIDFDEELPDVEPMPQMTLREIRLRQRCDVLDQQFRDVCLELESFDSRDLKTRKVRIRMTFLQTQADKIEKEKEQAVKKLTMFEKKRSQK